MRVFVVSVLSAAAIFLPSFATADPVQAAAQPTAASTATPAPTAVQAPAAPSQTATETGPESVVVNAEKVDLDQIVCKEKPPEIGSRLGGGRECHTQRQWNQRMRESQDITRHQEQTGFIGR